MSGFTAEGTEFADGRCKACGYTAYGLAEDGPRCHGCRRFVLKDTGVTALDGVEYNATRAAREQDHRLDEQQWLRMIASWADDVPTPQMFMSPRLRDVMGAFLDLVELSSDDDPPESRRARRRRIRRERREELKADTVLAEAEAILKGEEA